jgi:hypothetical protein
VLSLAAAASEKGRQMEKEGIKTHLEKSLSFQYKEDLRMYELKTKENDNSVIEFIEKVDSLKKREDAYKLLDIFTETTGYQANMWGPSIIGFGSYHYKYETGHEGDAPLVAFSPRKAKISLYFATGDMKREELLKKFGKHTSGKACMYINKVADIEVDVLKELILQSIKFLRETYPEKERRVGPGEHRESGK